MSVRVRFAPSPTGSPHVGNLRTAIYDWLFARKEGGQFIARLEDTDRTPGRYQPEGIPDIEASLRFLGIEPDEWWVSGGPVGPYVQSERLGLYQEAAQRLLDSKHAYRCYCTRERLDEMRAAQQARHVPTGYDRKCRNLSDEERARLDAEGLPSVVRLAMPLEGVTVVKDAIRGEISYDNRTQDDQVLVKSDGFPTYFLACAVDDHAMGITHIFRGDDWLSSAAKLVQVFACLGYEAPEFVHLPLILGTDRKKLSKRHGATQFTDFMEAGYLPEALLNFLVLLGWSAGDENRELFTREELVQRFSLKGISEHPAIFDYDKLKWMNGQYIRQSAPERIVQLCLPYLQREGLLPECPSVEQLAYAERALYLDIERMKLLSEAPDMVRFYFEELNYPTGYDEKGALKWFHTDHLKPMLTAEVEAFEALPDWNAEALEAAVRGISEAMDIPFAKVIHPTRLAATGRTVGPGLFETLWALGRDRTVSRLKSVIKGV